MIKNKNSPKALAKKAEEAAKKKGGKLSYKEEREYTTIEETISVKETEIEKLKANLGTPEILADAKKLVEISTEVHNLESDVEKMYARWQELEAKKGNA